MATYLVLATMSSSGVGTDGSSVKDAIADGAPESRKLIEAHGGKLVETYLTMGQYDGAMIVEFPDDLACTQAMLAMREFGVGTETLRAYPEGEWGKIAEGI